MKKIIKSIKNYIVQLWHRKRHSLSARFTKSPAEYIVELAGLIAWTLLILSTKEELSNLVVFCVAIMFGARAFPGFKAFWKGDTEKLDYLKKRRIESSACLREINMCLVKPEYAGSEKINEIRQKLLNCIVETVRAYRNDRPGSKIFSNLLIPEGDYLTVTIRNAPGRTAGTRYKQSALMCSEVLSTKKPIFFGNIQPIADRDVPYKSFMAIPVLDYTRDKCLAIVTIDSTEVHHFDEIYESFDTLLSPYITTITTTFILEDVRKLEKKK